MLNFVVYLDQEGAPSQLDSNIISDSEVESAPKGILGDYGPEDFVGVLRFNSSASELLESLISYEESIHGDGEERLSLLLPQIVLEGVRLGIQYAEKKHKKAPE